MKSLLLILLFLGGVFKANAANVTPQNFSNPDFTVTTVGPATNVVRLKGTNFWQFNDGITLAPSIVSSFVAMTNLVAFGAFIERSISLQGVHSYTLILGVNDIAAANLTTLKVIGTTATATDTTLNIDNGIGFGQLILLQNLSTNVATFIMPAVQAQTGDPSKTNRLKGGSWIPKRFHETIVLYNDGTGFTELGRTPGTNQTENLWQLVTSGGVTNLQPVSLDYNFHILNGGELWGSTIQTTTTNTTLGLGAGTALNSSSLFNTAVGKNALHAGTSSVGATAIGEDALKLAGGGANDNTAVGAFSLSNLTTGDQNTALGRDAGLAITSENGNTFYGYATGGGIIGASNTVVGANSGASANTVGNVIEFGFGVNASHNNDVLIGNASSLAQIDTGASDGSTIARFGSAITHTTGNLAEFANNGTNQFSVGVGELDYFSRNPVGQGSLIIFTHTDNVFHTTFGQDQNGARVETTFSQFLLAIAGNYALYLNSGEFRANSSNNITLGHPIIPFSEAYCVGYNLFKSNDNAGNSEGMRFSYADSDGPTINVTAAGTGVYHPFTVKVGSIKSVQFDDTTGASTTGMLLYENGASKRVTIGAADSGGVGFRVLRIPN